MCCQPTGSQCSVCGDSARSSRLGSLACHGCIIFFRRAVIRKSKYACTDQKRCRIRHERRPHCQFCRFQKCLQVGMQTASVCKRDCWGPTNKPTSATFMSTLLKLQRRQLREHRNQSAPGRQRADAHDLNRVFKWSFLNAIKWALQFEPFRRLSNAAQKSIIAEFGFSFLLVDQAFRTVTESVGAEFWMLQNGTFLHSDFFFGLEIGEETSRVDSECSRIHSEFVESLQESIRKPFERLKIDKFEVAALKTLLLLTPSFPNLDFVTFHDETLKSRRQCLKELKEHCDEQRFGELLLLLGSVRSAVKTVYNHTQVSDLFDSTRFDPFVTSFFLV